MNVTIKVSPPELVGKIGKQKTSVSWNFLSHGTGGHREEFYHILDSCGVINNKTPWICDGQTFDVNKFWLSKPNTMFTLRFLNDGICYVDHYYYAELLDSVIKINFIGQHMEYLPRERFKLYNIGDERLSSNTIHKNNIKFLNWTKDLTIKNAIGYLIVISINVFSFYYIASQGWFVVGVFFGMLVVMSGIIVLLSWLFKD